MMEHGKRRLDASETASDRISLQHNNFRGQRKSADTHEIRPGLGQKVSQISKHGVRGSGIGRIGNSPGVAVDLGGYQSPGCRPTER